MALSPNTAWGGAGVAAGLWALTHRYERSRNSTARNRRHNMGVAVLGATFAAPVGALITLKGGKTADVGLGALKTAALLARGKPGITGTALRMAADVKIFKDPAFKKILGTMAEGDNVAIVAGLMSIPISHRFVTRALSKWMNINSLHYHAAALPSRVEGMAGVNVKNGRESISTAPSKIGMATVNINTKIGSYYDPSAAMHKLAREY